VRWEAILYKKGGGKRGKPGEFPLSPMGAKRGEGGKTVGTPFLGKGFPLSPLPTLRGHTQVTDSTDEISHSQTLHSIGFCGDIGLLDGGQYADSVGESTRRMQD